MNQVIPSSKKIKLQNDEIGFVKNEINRFKLFCYDNLSHKKTKQRLQEEELFKMSISQILLFNQTLFKIYIVISSFALKTLNKLKEKLPLVRTKMNEFLESSDINENSNSNANICIFFLWSMFIMNELYFMTCYNDIKNIVSFLILVILTVSLYLLALIKNKYPLIRHHYNNFETLIIFLILKYTLKSLLITSNFILFFIGLNLIAVMSKSYTLLILNKYYILMNQLDYIISLIIFDERNTTLRILTSFIFTYYNYNHMYDLKQTNTSKMKIKQPNIITHNDNLNFIPSEMFNINKINNYGFLRALIEVKSKSIIDDVNKSQSKNTLIDESIQLKLLQENSFIKTLVKEDEVSKTNNASDIQFDLKSPDQKYIDLFKRFYKIADKEKNNIVQSNMHSDISLVNVIKPADNKPTDNKLKESSLTPNYLFNERNKGNKLLTSSIINKNLKPKNSLLFDPINVNYEANLLQEINSYALQLTSTKNKASEEDSFKQNNHYNFAGEYIINLSDDEKAYFEVYLSILKDDEYESNLLYDKIAIKSETINEFDSDYNVFGSSPNIKFKFELHFFNISNIYNKLIKLHKQVKDKEQALAHTAHEFKLFCYDNLSQ